MSPGEEKGSPDNPHEWLRRAKSNLEMARAAVRLKDVCLEDPCFEAEQAAEKAIKAVLRQLGIRFPYTHDLAALLRLLKKAGYSVPRNIQQASRLTRFAIATRYPGLEEPVTRKEYEKAVAIAESVVRWAEERIRKKS